MRGFAVILTFSSAPHGLFLCSMWPFLWLCLADVRKIPSMFLQVEPQRCSVICSVHGIGQPFLHHEVCSGGDGPFPVLIPGLVAVARGTPHLNKALEGDQKYRFGLPLYLGTHISLWSLCLAQKKVPSSRMAGRGRCGAFWVLRG